MICFSYCRAEEDNGRIARTISAGPSAPSHYGRLFQRPKLSQSSRPVEYQRNLFVLMVLTEMALLISNPRNYHDADHSISDFSSHPSCLRVNNDLAIINFVVLLCVLLSLTIISQSLDPLGGYLWVARREGTSCDQWFIP
jgi:hypothetical protein